MKIGIVIPARLESIRLPGKVLQEFIGLPMIEHVWRRTQIITPKIETIIATDSEQIKNTCDTFGAKTIMTHDKHINGLSRVGEVSKKLQWDFYIILQADELLVDPKDLSLLEKTIKDKNQYDFYNLITDIAKTKELKDKHTVKCFIRSDNTIINFMRIANMANKNEDQLNFIKKVCGVFAISSQALKNVVESNVAEIALHESIEQMKIIELNLKILGVRIEENYPSVNTKKDAKIVKQVLVQNEKQKNILRVYAKDEYL